MRYILARPKRLSLALALTFLVALFVAPTVSAQDKSGVDPKTISLPSGPGSIEGLGESFQPTLNTGTAKYQIGLVTPPGTAGQTPALALSYDGGGGNGVLGFGWQLELPFIQRRSDDGIPRYVDGGNNQDDDGDGQVDEPDEIDVFIDASREELVPSDDGYYLRANEGSFIRYSRVEDHWVGVQPDGTRLEFGITPAARVADASTGRVYRWLLERSTDPNGNTIVYAYQSFDGAENTNQKYLATITYGPGSPPWNSYHFVTFIYEDRPDWFEDGRARFLVRTGKRLVAVVMATQGPELPAHLSGDFNDDGQTDYLNRKYQLRYEGHPHWSLLTSVTWVGSDGVSVYPSATFSYTTSPIPDDISAAGHVLAARNAPPKVMDNAFVDLVDLNGDALPDILQTRLSGPHRAFLNGGESEVEGENAIAWKDGGYLSGDPRTYNVNLSSSSGAIAHLADMDADGLSDLVYEALDRVYYFRNTSQISWATRRAMKTGGAAPPSPFGKDKAVKTADIDFNKHIDIIRSIPVGGSFQYQIWFNLGDETYSRRKVVAPATGFMLSDAGVDIADFNGDRVPDILRVRPASVQVTAGLGHGDFAAVVEVPLGYYLNQQQVDRARLQDINGDGLADLVVEGAQANQLWYWVNRGNYTLDHRRRILSLPPAHSLKRAVRWADLNGNGTTDLVYADSNAASKIETIDIGELLGSVPSANLLRSIDNGLGRTITIDYATSTRFLVEDRAGGHTWPHVLPFPIQVVSRVTVDDSMGHRYETDFSYHDGYYDGEEKEFRGFAEVVETQYGDGTAPTTVTHHRYDVGDQIESRKGLLVAQTILGPDGHCTAPARECYQQVSNTLATYTVIPGVTFSAITRTHTLVNENTDEPAQLLQTFAFDLYGNQTEQLNYGQVCPRADGSLDLACGNDELLTYTSYAINAVDWIVGSVSEVLQTDLVGSPVSHQRRYYDGVDFMGLPLGQVAKGNLTRQEDDPSPGSRQDPEPPGDHDHHWVQSVRNRYDAYGNITAIMDPNGRLGSDGAPDANGHWRELTYDPILHTFPVSEAIQLGNGQSLTLTADYDLAWGVITRAVDFNGQELLFGYDPFARLTAIVKPGDTLALPTQVFTYTLASPVSSVETASRKVSGETDVYRTISYVDGLGRALQTRSQGEGDQAVVQNGVIFNQRGTEWQKFLPYFDDGWAYAPPPDDLAKTTLTYDPMGRVVATTQPDGSIATTQYLPLEQVLFDEEDTNPDSPHANTPTTFRFDGLERQIATLEHNGSEVYTTSFGYDALGDLITITDSQGNIKRQTFDALQRKTAIDDPDRGRTTYSYDDAGNVLEVVDAKGQRITYTYDGANRVLTENDVKTTGDTTVDVRYHYDADLAPEYPDAHNTNGRLTWVEDTSGREYLSYDARGNLVGRIKRILPPGGAPALDFVTLTGYDAMDRPVQLTYPDGVVVAYQYNDQNLLEAIPNFVTGIDYLASGQRDAMTTADGVRTAYQYDIRQRLSALAATHTATGAALQDLRYHFDGVSNILGIDDVRAGRTASDDDTRTFAYDDLYRLTGVRYTAGGDYINYTYDPIGNLVRQTSNVPAPNLGDLHYGQNAGPHALTEVGGQPWAYDRNGNLTGKPSFTFAWDFRDRLIAVNGPSGLCQDHTFDYAGNRVSKQVRTATGTQTVLYPDNAVEVRGDQIVKYVFAGDQRVAEVRTPFSPWRLIRGFAGAVQPLFGFDANGNGNITAAEIAGRGGDTAVVELVEINDALAVFFAHTEDAAPPLNFAVISAALQNYRSHAGSAPPTPASDVFYHPDHLGSAAVLTNRQGGVLERTAYYPYGAERARNGQSGVAHRFTGQELDADIGLYDYEARFYDPVVGRFISVDPLWSQQTERGPGDTTSLNLYVYALDNPLRLIDPTGMDAEVSVKSGTSYESLLGNRWKYEDRFHYGSGIRSSTLTCVLCVKDEAVATAKGETSLFGVSREYGGVVHNDTHVLGNSRLGLFIEGTSWLGKATYGIGVVDGSVGVKVGLSLVEGKLGLGINVFGWSYSVFGKARLGLEGKLSLGKTTEVGGGVVSGGVEVGKAKGPDSDLSLVDLAKMGINNIYDQSRALLGQTLSRMYYGVPVF